MSGFAVRNDGEGWVSVGGPDDVGPDAWYSPKQPPPTYPRPPTREESAESVRESRDLLLSMAANRMGPLRDAVDTDSATTEEVERLKRWQLYRIALNRIEQQEGFPTDIQWPESPEAPPLGSAQP